MRPLDLDWDEDTDLTEIITVSAVKSQLRIPHDEFDELIETIHLPGAVKWAEAEMHRSILSKPHRWVLQDFPRTASQEIRLPRGRTQSVSSIQYTSSNSTTTLSGSDSSPEGSDFRQDLRSDEGGRVYPAHNNSWPSVDIYAPAPVVITFNAGWTATQVPGDVKVAICMYVADALEVTGAMDVMANTDLTVKERLLTAYKLDRF